MWDYKTDSHFSQIADLALNKNYIMIVWITGFVAVTFVPVLSLSAVHSVLLSITLSGSF